MTMISIVDYGLGNIFSITQALQHCGAATKLAQTPDDILEAEMLILPGVGAFSHGRQALAKKNLIKPLQAYASSNRPLLGICLGMQLLFESSEEFGFNEGLGILAGTVVPVPRTKINHLPHKIPHIGWNTLQTSNAVASQSPLLKGIELYASVYFVHSFQCVPSDPLLNKAHTTYNGREICAVAEKNATFGVQFHPEKSGGVGLKILDNFLKLR